MSGRHVSAVAQPLDMSRMEAEHPEIAPPSPSQVRCILSSMALGGEFIVYLIWASSPADQAVGMKPFFWAAAFVVGLFYAVRGLRLAQSWRGRLAGSALVCVHVLSLLFLFFMIAGTGMRP